MKVSKEHVLVYLCSVWINKLVLTTKQSTKYEKYTNSVPNSCNCITNISLTIKLPSYILLTHPTTVGLVVGNDSFIDHT